MSSLSPFPTCPPHTTATAPPSGTSPTLRQDLTCPLRPLETPHEGDSWSGLTRKPHPSLAGPQNRTDRCLCICWLISFLPTLPCGRPRRPRHGQWDPPPPHRRCRRFSLASPPPPPPIRPSTYLLSSAESSTPVPESGLTPPATSLHPPSDRNVHTSRCGSRYMGFDGVWRLTACGSSPPPPHPLLVYVAESKKTEDLSLPPTTRSNWTSPHPYGVSPPVLYRRLVYPPPRPSAPSPPRLPVASTV